MALRERSRSVSVPSCVALVLHPSAAHVASNPDLPKIGRFNEALRAENPPSERAVICSIDPLNTSFPLNPPEGMNEEVYGVAGRLRRCILDHPDEQELAELARECSEQHQGTPFAAGPDVVLEEWRRSVADKARAILEPVRFLEEAEKERQVRSEAVDEAMDLAHEILTGLALAKRYGIDVLPLVEVAAKDLGVRLKARRVAATDRRLASRFGSLGSERRRVNTIERLKEWAPEYIRKGLSNKRIGEILDVRLGTAARTLRGMIADLQEAGDLPPQPSKEE